MEQKKQTLSRSSVNGRRRWQHHEETALIDFLKRNREFEKPLARLYYARFLLENGIDTNWRLVRGKVRNMRMVYRKAKDYESQQTASDKYNMQDLKRELFKMCWFMDDFDDIFANFTDNINYSDPTFDEELSKDGSLIITDDIIAGHNSILNIKKEKDEDTSVQQQPEPQKPNQSVALKEYGCKQPIIRNRTNPVRKWQRKEEIALVDFLKRNRDFEKPTARIYYTTFIQENRIDIDWHLVRSKVRNMRVAYRKAKEHEIKEVDSNSCNLENLRSDILKICWFVDDFDILFPNEMDNSNYLRAYNTPDPIIDDDFSKDETSFNIESSSKNYTTNFLPEEDSTSSSSTKSLDGDLMAVQTDLSDLKRQCQDEFSNLRQKELELAREKFNFEKEKFRQEIRLKEKEIDSEEKLKVMEIQMKERIAIRKLEIEEMVAFRTANKPENSYSNIYHNLM